MKKNILDNKNKINIIDKEKMLENVSGFPMMLKEAVTLVSKKEINPGNDFEGIVISGMGGSAICGDIVKATLADTLDIPINVNRGYSLPKSIKGKILFFTISYSGNTEETLSSLEIAEQRGFKIVAVCSGGKLSEIAKQKNYLQISVPKGIQPRAALPYLLAPILVVLEKLKLVEGVSSQILESIEVLEKISKQVNPIKQLAQKINEKTPVLLTSNGLTEAAGLRWMTQINENSKTLAHVSVFPELGHNEIEGLAELKKENNPFYIVILRDSSEHERIKKRIEVTKSVVLSKVDNVSEIYSQGNCALARILSLILFGDFLSVYLAILKNVDPSPVKIISKIKKELSK